MPEQKVALLGATGNIGTEFVKLVAQKDAPRLPRNHNPTSIIAMAHKGGMVLNRDGIDIQNHPKHIARMQELDSQYAAAGKPRTAFREWIGMQPGFEAGAQLQDLFHQIVQQGLIDDVVFVDLTASDLTDFHSQIIEAGGSVVTANKIPVAQRSWDVFKLLTRFRRRYGFSCSVMAGAGAVPILRDSFDNDDTVHSIEGCFSGTLGKLCTLLHDGEIPFSEAVKQLKLSGDTEPDPRDDLSGMDVAKKLVILARTAGYQVGLEDVEIEPFVPGGFRELADCSVDEFMARASIFDQEMAAKFAETKKAGKTLRYVASFKRVDGRAVLKLGLREEALDSPLGSLKGNGNKIVIYTDAYNVLPRGMDAPGSGVNVTAVNIRADLLQLLSDREM